MSKGLRPVAFGSFVRIIGVEDGENGIIACH